MSISHEIRPRGDDAVPGSVFTAGRFGRMFRALPPSRYDAASLIRLAAGMVQAAELDDTASSSALQDARENRSIPSGYTYFGQFITHDLTFDPASSFQRQNDPDALENFRTPRFDLDSIYGGGPGQQPYLYRTGAEPVPHPRYGFDQRGIAFLLGGDNGSDLPRNSEGRALIADPRNDEHLIISQLHVAFLNFHNRLVEQLHAERGLTGGPLFEEAQRLVRWHYQWVVLHDYLPRILGAASHDSGAMLGDLLRLEPFEAGSGAQGVTVRSGLRFYSWQKSPYIPVEFSAAAFRFGHSMIRPSYFINDAVRAARSDRKIPLFGADSDPLATLAGNRPLPRGWEIDWKYFFELERGSPPQWAYKFSPNLAASLGNLAGMPDVPSLALRDLLRGDSLGLPSGQSIARAMGMTPLSDADLGLSARGCPELDGNAPLWFYILREAELLGGTQSLGPVGGRICSEVLVGLMLGDPASFLKIDPLWVPTLAVAGRFGMAELLAFAVGEQAEAWGDASARPLGSWRRAFVPASEMVEANWP
ncbi:MAG: hypothetical protein QOD42_715 [Sphingomonadales bacterium]|jgi:hypothetical protein|nr:hypothetical protein [Sphingomonadales bacterium]